MKKTNPSFCLVPLKHSRRFLGGGWYFLGGQETGIIYSKTLQKLWRLMTKNTEEMKADSKQVIEDVYVGDSGSLMMAVMSSC